MFMKRVQPFQLGFTEFEIQVLIKILNGEELTKAEDQRADKLHRTMMTQYERLRVKRSDDDSYENRDHRHDDGRSGGSRISYEDAKRADTYTVPPEATSEPKPRRAVRTSRR